MTDIERRERPFFCGTQMIDWREVNCKNCVKQGRYTDETENEFAWHCDIEKALDMAYADDGHVSAPIFQRMGGDSFRCNELVPIEPIQDHYARLMPAPTELAPIWLRLKRSAIAAWSFWIPPTDKEDHDYYEGLRSPFLAWSVAWGIHHNQDVRRRPLRNYGPWREVWISKCTLHKMFPKERCAACGEGRWHNYWKRYVGWMLKELWPNVWQRLKGK